MINTEFNPLDMATHGLLSGNSFTIAVQGHLTIIDIEPVPPSIIDRIGGAFFPEKYEKKEKKWKVTVTIFKDGKEFKETKEIKAQKQPKVTDVNIELTNNNKINISVKNIKS